LDRQLVEMVRCHETDYEIPVRRLNFFRLWVALSLFCIMFICGAAIVDLVRTLRLPPEPPTFALAEQEADKKCGPALVYLPCGDGSFGWREPDFPTTPWRLGR
jgi:hypothetical protein